MNSKETQQRYHLMGTLAMTTVVMAGLALFFVGSASPVKAAAQTEPLCGDGSAPDYGFTAALQQPHWTVGWQGYASEEAVAEVDTLFDQLNADSIAQAMILILPQDQVGNRVNCAVHFLRYMGLGEISGPRKDNGFVFLIVVEQDQIDVHYGVGLGLPALTAPELTDINRAAEDAYQPDHDMDSALMALAHGFDTVARAKYAPLISATGMPRGDSQQPLPVAPGVSLCGLLVLGVFIVLFLFLASRRGFTYGGPGFGSRGEGPPFGDYRGGSSLGGGGYRGGSTGRGGSGSGRSGRGN